jgi:hypothetical protein
MSPVFRAVQAARPFTALERSHHLVITIFPDSVPSPWRIMYR